MLAAIAALAILNPTIQVDREILDTQRLAVDPSGRFAVTASLDKTLRFWALPTGKLYSVERIPLGPREEGRLYFIALSPNGKTLAGGGWTGTVWDARPSVYLYDIGGVVRRRIGFLPQPISGLTFTSDGSHIVMGYRRGGLQLYEVDDGKLSATDSDYDRAVTGVASGSNGYVASASEDGTVRIYRSDLTLVVKAKLAEGAIPGKLAFSPDGRRLLVADRDRPRAELFSIPDLKSIGQVKAALGVEGVADVAWSGSTPTWIGPEVAAQSVARANGLALDGRRAIAASPYAEGVLCLTDNGSLWQVRDGNAKCLQARALGDDRGPAKLVQGAGNGQVVQFSYASWPNWQGSFDPAKSTLDILSSSSPSDPGPSRPKIVVRLEKNDSAIAALPLGDGGRIVAGALSLYRFRADGVKQWSVELPQSAGGVASSSGGDAVLVTLGDGTLRWYRVRDGRELLALYVGLDRRTWIAWTPDGYYACSPGGDELVRWRTREATYPFASFSRELNRPDIVNEALTPEAVARPVDIAAKLPPTAQILSQHQMSTFGKAPVRTRLRLDSETSEPIIGISYRVDGQEIARDVGSFAPGTVREKVLDLPSRDLNLTVVVWNRYSSSEPSTVALRFVEGKR